MAPTANPAPATVENLSKVQTVFKVVNGKIEVRTIIARKVEFTVCVSKSYDFSLLDTAS